MTTLVTRPAPDFTAEAVMSNGQIKNFTLSALRGKYVLLFFYPLDFTFVCPTEIIAFDRQIEAFKARNVELVSVSVDSPYSHFAWKSTPTLQGGIGDIRYTMVSDITKQISRDYGVLLNEAVALRGLFLIDKEGIVQHQLVNNLPLGRSVDEALRMVDALQFFEKNGEVCPANWHEGEEAIQASNEGIAKYLSAHA